MDVNDRIVLWNRGCEQLLGRRADGVLGRRCADVICGRDANGNVYCVRNCPVSLQAREMPHDPVNTFPLLVRTPRDGMKSIRVSVFHIPASRPTLATLVHVLRADGSLTSELEVRLGEVARRGVGSSAIRGNGDGNCATLTPREQDILRCLAEAVPTPAIAERLDISRVTVRNHTQRILKKLGVHSKLQAVVYAYRHELI
ncbi:MAG: LuxR C-terminal-related transcriptional regulator [Gemmatimonadota bacterium]